MQVTYTVLESEWREARYLYRTRGERSSGDGWALLLIIVPLVGSVGDTAHQLLTSSFSPRGSVLPLLLLLASLSAAGLMGMARHRDRRAGAAAGVTVGEWTAHIGEHGIERFRPASPDARVVRGWEAIRAYRVGRHVIVMDLRDEAGFEVFPLRIFSADEQAWLHRMTSRKMRNGRAADEARRTAAIRESAAPPPAESNGESPVEAETLALAASADESRPTVQARSADVLAEPDLSKTPEASAKVQA